jgi:hypothetical protein
MMRRCDPVSATSAQKALTHARSRPAALHTRARRAPCFGSSLSLPDYLTLSSLRTDHPSVPTNPPFVNERETATNPPNPPKLRHTTSGKRAKNALNAPFN